MNSAAPRAVALLAMVAMLLATALAACDRAARQDAPVSTAAAPFTPPPKPWPPGMVWIPGGDFTIGGVGPEARPDEFPVHRVRVGGFWMDETEVTNASFRTFVDATGYVTTAEKKPDWE